MKTTTIRGEPAVTRAQATANAWLAELAASDKARASVPLASDMTLQGVNAVPAPFTIKWLEPPVAPAKASDFSLKETLVGLGGFACGVPVILALGGAWHQAGLVIGWYLGLVFVAALLYGLCKFWRLTLGAVVLAILFAWLGTLGALLALILVVLYTISVTLANRKV